VGRRGLDRAVRDGVIVALLPDVYTAADLASVHRVRCAAAVRWGRGRVRIGGESSLHLYDDRFPAPPTVHCVVAFDHRVRARPWMSVRRIAWPRHWSSPDGIESLVAEDAVLDAWRRTSASRRKDLLYRVLWLRIVGPRRLVSAAGRSARLPDRAIFDGIMSDFLAGVQSPAEVLARREVFTGPAFADLEWHVELLIGGRRRTADALHRSSRTVVELDGEAYHSSRSAVSRDRERDTEFGIEGWQTVRFSYRDLTRRPEWCRRSLLRIIRQRGPA